MAACLLLGCIEASAPAAPAGDDGGAQTGAYVTEPFPIDAGGAPGTPDSYKGLELRLVDNGEPPVTPVDGVIGLVCVGMSNGSQECDDFIQNLGAARTAERNPAVRVVNCAVGGHAIERWNDPAYDAVLWDDCLSRKIGQAGVRPDQVRGVWHKAANQFTTLAGGAAKPLYPAAGSDY